MVHVIQLLGCVATGPTTEAAIEADAERDSGVSPFSETRHAEPFDHEDPIELRVIEHPTEGVFDRQRTPYVTYGPDLDPISEEEIEQLLKRTECPTAKS